MKDTLINALHIAGTEQLKYFNIQIKTKEKESLSNVVTEVDIKCENKILELISKSYPGHNIITEESGFINNYSDYTWVIDPLDGTSNFAAGIPWFGVLIALIKGSVILMSGAYIPVSDQLYFAERSKGAFLNNKSINVNNNLTLRNSLFAFSTDYSDNEIYLEHGTDIYKYLVQNCRNVRSTNSLVDLLYVAESKLGGCINLYTRIWDIAAPYLILKEAGGNMIDLYGNELNFSVHENLINKNFAILCGTIEIVSILKQIVKEK